eukprot:2994040-Alexandrium_andersonii.AAC.1
MVMLRELIFAFHRLYQDRRGLAHVPMELGGERYWRWKQHLVTTERHLLKELGFVFSRAIEHPH